MKVLGLFVLITLCAGSLAFRKQGAAVKGKFLCGTQPLRNARVKLVDQDSGPDPDDLLDEGYTDQYGNFQLDGSTRELSTIDVYLKVYHDCNDKSLGLEVPCQRKVWFKIPSSRYHSGTAKPKNWVDIGEINMEINFKDEERDCSH